MKTSSCKGKGRRLQQFVAKELLILGAKHGLEPDDIKSVSMGVSGLDILLSPAARRLFGPLAVECKNVESLNISTTFHTHAAKYPASLPVLISKKNRTDALITLRFSDFLLLYEAGLPKPVVVNE